jgi:acetolactate synthase-1/2/3 large subunit
MRIPGGFLTVAEAVADWLAERGIRHVFGIIGAGNLALWEAITRKGATEIVCCHHEQAAAMAASFYQRAGGGISVALVTTGAGSSNCITGVLAAFMDSTPLLVISGNETAASLTGKTRVKGVQGYGSAELAIEFTKQSMRVTSARDPLNFLNCAYNTALHGRHGPAWVDIPRDVQVAHI